MAVLSTATTNFDHSVVVEVEKKVAESLRAGTPWTPPGSIRPGKLMSGYNGTIRTFSLADLAAVGTSGNISEGVVPTAQTLSHDYVDYASAQFGGYVQWTDLASAESPFDLRSQATNKVQRQFAIAVDDVARAAFAAYPADISAPSRTITAADLYNLAAIMKRRNVGKIGGSFVGIAGPELQNDIMALTGFVDASKAANSGAVTLLPGAIGLFAGIQFLDPQSRDISTLSAARGSGTAVASTGVFTITAHGLSVGERIQFTAITSMTGFTLNQDYYVNSVPTADTFTVSATKGGATVTGTTNGTAISFKNQQYRLQLIGADSLGMGDLGTQEILISGGPTQYDPLAQNYTVGWKVRLGAAILKFNETDSGGTDVPRTAAGEFGASFQFVS